MATRFFEHELPIDQWSICRRYDYNGDHTVIVDKRRRRDTAKRIWRSMKRRAAVEPTIGHLKTEHRLYRNLFPESLLPNDRKQSAV